MIKVENRSMQGDAMPNMLKIISNNVLLLLVFLDWIFPENTCGLPMPRIAL